MVTRLKELAAAGDPQLPIAFCLNAVTVVDHGGAAARAAARTASAPYFDVVASLDPTVELDPELLPRVRNLCRMGDHDGAGRLIPDDVLGKFAFVGTPIEVAEQAATIIDAGASRVEFDTPFGLTSEHGLQLLCDEVLPRIRSLVG